MTFLKGPLIVFICFNWLYVTGQFFLWFIELNVSTDEGNFWFKCKCTVKGYPHVA